MNNEISGIEFLRDEGGTLEWRDHSTTVGLFKPEGLVVASPFVIVPLEQLGGFHLIIENNQNNMTRAVAKILGDPERDVLLGVLYGSTPMGYCLWKWIEMANELCSPVQ